MRKMFSEKQIEKMIEEKIQEHASFESDIRNAIDLYDMPTSGDYTGEAKAILEKAVRGKTIAYGGTIFFVGTFFESSSTIYWTSFNTSSVGEIDMSLSITINLCDNNYTINYYEN